MVENKLHIKKRTFSFSGTSHANNIESKYKFAFTLAEVLIALAIIGGVAVILVSGFKNIQKTKMETKLKNTYAILQQSIRRSFADGMSIDEIIQDKSVTAIKNWTSLYIEQYLKYSKVCYGTKGCWNNAENVKTLSGTKFDWSSKVGLGLDIVVYKLNNNSLLSFDGWSSRDMDRYFGININPQNMIIFFDINGENKPNIIGKDIYILGLANNNLVPAGQDKTYTQVKDNCTKGNGFWCLKYVMDNNWKIDPNVLQR